MAHAIFDALTRRDYRLYRGAGSQAEAEVLAKAGVGPIRIVARRVVDDAACCGLGETAMKWLASKLSNADPRSPVSIPSLSPSLALDAVLRASVEPTLNHLSANDHVYSESPLQTPSTYPDLQSTTKSPATAILYAYGIRPGHVGAANQLEFFSGKPNSRAAVAVLLRETDDILAKPTSVAAAGNEEVERRIGRDYEVLLTSLVLVERVVDLPPFDVRDPDRSLDEAAGGLRCAGVVT